MKRRLRLRGLTLYVLLATLQVAWAQNDPMPSALYRQQEAELVIKGGTLKGTLFTPSAAKRPPVVLIIAGSGPTDRDGNSSLLPGKNNSLLQLADSLAAHGIASLRYDKRGVAKSQIKELREENMQFSDGADDAIGWIRWLREQGFRKIYVAGHSEGSLVGLLAAQTEKLNGFISLAGVGRSIDKVLREQFAAGGGPDSLKKLAGRYLDTLLMEQRIAKPHPLLFSVFRPSVQPYMISWLRYDPQTLMRSLSCRALIIQGTNDLQVKEVDAQLLKQANQKATLVIIEKMNHVLKEVESQTPAANIASYSNPKLAVMTELVISITQFVKGKFN
ncbi:MAG: alpha/beta hydrolase family protein [Sphingomonadales bacterium]